MTPEQEAAIKDMEVFKEEMKKYGKETEYNLWNTTATIFGLILAAISIISTIKPESNKCILYAGMASSCLGMFCIWRIFRVQRRFYTESFILAKEVIEHPDKQCTKTEEENFREIIRQRDYSEEFANWCLFIGVVSLVLLVVL